jgi:formate dehydrogenase accessory protein FdhD
MVKAQAGHLKVNACRWQDDSHLDVQYNIATEVPVALVYNGISYAVMMATPADLEDFGLGFSLSEGIIGSQSEMEGLNILKTHKGLMIAMDIPAARYAKIAERRRHLAGRTGCGLCGIESLEEAIPDLAPLAATAKVSHTAIYKAYDDLYSLQPEKQATGAVHCAAFVDFSGNIRLVKEDVGRHNALDKVIGAAVSAKMDPLSGFIFITSRCSYEMVQKTLAFGCSVLVAISAPTTLAVQMAQNANLALVTLARQRNFIAFTYPERVTA